MSWSCCVSPSGMLLQRDRWREREQRQEEQQEEKWRKMDVFELRERYRSSTERHRRTPQVLVFTAVSVRPSHTVTVLPVTQGLTSPWRVTLDQDKTTFDPWIIPLGHRQPSCEGSSNEEDRSSPEQSPHDGFMEDHPDAFPTAASITSSLRSSSLHLEEHQSSGGFVCNYSSISAWRGPWTFSAPGLRSSHRLSVGGRSCSSAGGLQNQSYNPFPNRRNRRISETARRLGMYSTI